MTIDRHDKDLALFRWPEVESTTLKMEWIKVRPVYQLTEGAAIEFQIPGTSMTYIDHINLLVSVKLKIVKADGTDLPTGEKVGLTNNALHSVFSQVDVNVQQVPTSQGGTNYAFIKLI